MFTSNVCDSHLQIILLIQIMCVEWVFNQCEWVHILISFIFVRVCVQNVEEHLEMLQTCRTCAKKLGILGANFSPLNGGVPCVEVSHWRGSTVIKNLTSKFNPTSVKSNLFFCFLVVWSQAYLPPQKPLLPLKNGQEGKGVEGGPICLVSGSWHSDFHIVGCH